MNQIMDHSGPKKAKAAKNPADTKNIIKVYAMILIIISLAFIGKGAYALFENKKIKDISGIEAQNSEPNITLHADQDIVSITVSDKSNIEEIAYQWYRGTATAEDIKMIQENPDSEETEEDNDDEEVSAENEKVVALGKLITEKGTGNNEMTVQNIGIPKGNTSLYIRIKTTGNAVATEYIQHYHTDVGVDKIAPEIKVTLQGKKLLVTAKDETKISYLTYSVNGGTEQTVDTVEGGDTIKTEIELDETQDSQIKICAVDDSKNSEIYDKTYSLYAGTPKIEFLAEEDYSLVYVKITYPKGIKKVEYSLNGKEKVEEYDNPEDKKEVNLEIKTEEGHNEIKIKAYAEEEEVYAEEVGECEYSPQ